MTYFRLPRTNEYALAGSSGQVTAIFPDDQGLSLIYGEEENLPPSGAEATLGTLPYAVTFLATLECAEVKRYIPTRGFPVGD